MLFYYCCSTIEITNYLHCDRVGGVNSGESVCAHQPSAVSVCIEVSNVVNMYFLCVLWFALKNILQYLYGVISIVRSLVSKFIDPSVFQRRLFIVNCITLNLHCTQHSAHTTWYHRASQRTAAVIVLRKLYPTFREETSVVHRYTLRVLHLLAKSMRLYEHAATQQVCVVFMLLVFSAVMQPLLCTIQ